MQLQNLLTILIGSIMFLGNVDSALAQIVGLPKCAQDIAAAIGGEGLCADTDFTCVCLGPLLWYNFVQQVEVICDAADQQAAISFGVAFCANICITYSASPASPTGTYTGTRCNPKTTATAAATTTPTAVATTTPTGAATAGGVATTTSKAAAASRAARVGGGEIGIALMAAVAFAL